MDYKIPEGYRELNKKEMFEPEDLWLGDSSSDSLDLSKYYKRGHYLFPYDKDYQYHHLTIRKIEQSQSTPVSTTSKFKPGDKVLVKFPEGNQFKAEVICVNTDPINKGIYTAINREHVTLFSGMQLSGHFTFSATESMLSLIQPEIKINNNVVLNNDKDQGVNVGCTFVPDETIKAIAKMRGLIKE